MKSQKQEIIGKYYHNNNLKEYFEYVFLYCSLLLNRKEDNYNEEEDDKILDRLDSLIYDTNKETRQMMENFSESLDLKNIEYLEFNKSFAKKYIEESTKILFWTNAYSPINLNDQYKRESYRNNSSTTNSYYNTCPAKDEI